MLYQALGHEQALYNSTSRSARPLRCRQQLFSCLRRPVMAAKEFFSAMPADSGIAFVLIQHLDPAHRSVTAELLARNTAMKVVQAEDQMPVEINHVYVIPPNKDLTIRDGVLHLSAPITHHGTRMPISFSAR